MIKKPTVQKQICSVGFFFAYCEAVIDSVTYLNSHLANKKAIKPNAKSVSIASQLAPSARKDINMNTTIPITIHAAQPILPPPEPPVPPVPPLVLLYA